MVKVPERVRVSVSQDLAKIVLLIINVTESTHSAVVSIFGSVFSAGSLRLLV